MSSLKKYSESKSVLTAAQERIAYVFDHFPKVFVSFSGGKDSTVMLHLVMDEAIKRDRKVAVLLVDLEAQYAATIEHAREMFATYADHIEPYWCCLPMALRNAVTNYEPQWMCWDPDKQDIWVRDLPPEVVTEFPWYRPGMEFEEFVPLWGKHYSDGELTAGFIGIRADESLNRFRTIATRDKESFNGKSWTTRVVDDCYNIYPLYDWKTQDIWRFHAMRPELSYNHVYDLMQQAGVPLSQQRLCQPYGDDQRKGLWLYHILEPQTWFKLIARVNGAHSGAFYVQESGNVTGYNKITKPDGHTWKSFTNLLLSSMPKQTREHYITRFRGFIDGWKGRGYDVIPDEAPKILEDKHWAPSWRRMCKVLLRNDYWCKGLGLTQPKSAAYGEYLSIRDDRRKFLKAEDAA